MEQPFVSVVVLTYNQKDTVARTLDSILAQKCSYDFEILIGDDASTDGTVEVLDYYAKRYDNVKVFVQPENVGVTKNAYDLLMKTTGKYIASCEGDDFWCDENKLQKQVDFLENHPEYVGCSHDVNFVNEYGKVYYKNNPTWISLKRDYSYKDFKGVYLPGQSCSIVRRNIYLDKEKDFSLIYTASKYIGDRTTVLLCLPYGKFYRMKERMSCYSFSFAKDTQGITFQKFVNSKSSFCEEWEYTKKLEEYTKNNFEFSVNFRPYKHSLFFSSIVACFRRRKCKNQAVRPKDILASDTNKLGYVVALPVWFAIKLARKIKLFVIKKKYFASMRTERA